MNYLNNKMDIITKKENNIKLTWIKEKTFIFGYDKNLLINLNKIKKINKAYIFDLDYTLIKTKSKKKFPINFEDWELLYEEIPEKLVLKNSIIGIVTNQKGLKNQNQISEWTIKIENINKKIKIDFIFGSISDDRFRKPMCGSWEYIKNFYVNINWDKLIKNENIYYIGDAFGRKKDFSDTDIKYALNCKFKFKTPEIFFKIKNSDKIGNINYPIIKYFESTEQDELFSKLEKIINNNKKILIIMIGFPASGKSFLRKEIIKKFPQFYYSNNDDKTNEILSNMLVKKISIQYDFLIDDNTNLNKLEREKKMQLFNSYCKIGIWFNYELEVCWHLNWMRMYWFGEKLLPKVTYYTLNKKFISDNIDDGFDEFIQIKKIFKQFNLDDKIKYYF